MERTVPISGRVSPSIVKHLAEKAERLGLSLSKVVGMELSNAVDIKATSEEKCELINEKWKSVTGQLINEFSSSPRMQKKMIEFLTKEISKA